MGTTIYRGNLHRSESELTAWLAQATEEAAEPHLQLVDAHHHLWSDERGHYEIEELATDAAGNNVVATVYVECGTGYKAAVDYAATRASPVDGFLLASDEVAYARRVAEGRPTAEGIGACRGIVGFANLLLGEKVRSVLEAEIEAGGGRFRGIRQATAWDAAIGPLAYRNPPPGLLLDERFQDGFAELKPLALTYDAWVFFTQIPDVITLADRFPDTTIILDHFGGLIGVGPYVDRRNEAFKLWRTYIRRLAERPNVHLKMGGLGMISSGSMFHLDARPPHSADIVPIWKPFIEESVESFGPDRCLVGSNFPVDRQASSYTSFWNTYKSCTRQYSDQERRAILADTALRVYSLN